MHILMTADSPTPINIGFPSSRSFSQIVRRLSRPMRGKVSDLLANGYQTDLAGKWVRALTIRHLVNSAAQELIHEEHGRRRASRKEQALLERPRTHNQMRRCRFTLTRPNGGLCKNAATLEANNIHTRTAAVQRYTELR